jgi:hypothetical protein
MMCASVSPFEGYLESLHIRGFNGVDSCDGHRNDGDGFASSRITPKHVEKIFEWLELISGRNH